MVKNTMTSPRPHPDYYMFDEPSANDYYRVRVVSYSKVGQWIESQDQRLWRLYHKPYDSAFQTEYWIKGKLATMLQLRWAR